MRVRQEVFIASSFGEFRDLRSSLRERVRSYDLEPIDLNDNEPSHEPVLDVCLEAVRRSDVFLLLLGREYGSTPGGEDLSYTHLEYRAACEGEGQPTVLVYFVDAPADDDAPTEHSPPMVEWRREIMGRHRVSRLANDEEPESLAERICCRLVQVLLASTTDREQFRFDMRTAGEDALGEGGDLEDIDLTDLSETELERLEEQGVGEPTGEFGDEGGAPKSTVDVLVQPAAVAAAEQMGEARKAMNLGDRITAVAHLRRARDLRPLHIDATYWLARLLVGSTALPDLREASRLARRAARIASYEGRAIREAAAWIVAAQAEAELDNLELGLECARRAVDCARWFSSTHVELACQYARSGRTAKALESVRQAFYCRPLSIIRMNREPALLGLRKSFAEFKRNFLRQLRGWVGDILREEAVTRSLVVAFPDHSEDPDPQERLTRLESMGMVNLVWEGQNSARRHLAHLSGLGRAVIDEIRQSTVQLVDTEARGLRQRAQRILVAGAIGLSIGGVLLLGALIGLIGGGPSGGISVQIFFGLGLLIAGSIGVSVGLGSSRNAPAEAARAVRMLALSNLPPPNEGLTRRLNQCADLFLARVGRFEATVLVKGIFSPGTGPATAKVGRLVRLEPGDRQKAGHIILDTTALPFPFTGLATGVGMATAKHILVKITTESGAELLGARWACYFGEHDVTMLRREYPLAHEPV